MSYKGEYNGSMISSLYSNVYRVEYQAYIGRRMMDVNKIVTAMDEYHARDRCQRGTQDIRGGIKVELVGTLDAN